MVLVPEYYLIFIIMFVQITVSLLIIVSTMYTEYRYGDV